MILFKPAASILTLLVLTASATVAEVKPYEAIDRHALEAPAEAEQSLGKLAAYLVKPCKTEREKVRAIYRWVTDRIAYDCAARIAGQRKDGSAEAVLKTRLAVCEGYANLFQDLCGRAGVQTVKVLGYGKGVGYTPGKEFGAVNHAWNAVNLEQKWWLVEPTWGAGYENSGKYVKRFREFYFLPPPEQMIFTHLPKDPRWQLREPALTLKEWEKQPRVEQQLFDLGVTLPDVYAKLREASFAGFVKARPIPGATIAIRKAPLDKVLQAGQSYEFELRSAELGGMVAFSNGKGSRLTQEGDVFRVVLTAEKGTLAIGGQLPDSGTRYQYVLEYTVE